MSIVELLERLQPEEYWFGGTYASADEPQQPRPLVASCTFLADGRFFLLEGTYRYEARSTSHPFSVRLPVGTAGAPVCELRSSHTGAVSGPLFPVRGGYELLLSASDGRAVSCRFEVDRVGRVSITGVVTCGDNRFAFLAEGANGPERETLGNVVRVSGGRQA
jgi:hypothetical protein